MMKYYILLIYVTMFSSLYSHDQISWQCDIKHVVKKKWLYFFYMTQEFAITACENLDDEVALGRYLKLKEPINLCANQSREALKNVVRKMGEIFPRKCKKLFELQHLYLTSCVTFEKIQAFLEVYGLDINAVLFKKNEKPCTVLDLIVDKVLWDEQILFNRLPPNTKIIKELLQNRARPNVVRIEEEKSRFESRIEKLKKQLSGQEERGFWDSEDQIKQDLGETKRQLAAALKILKLYKKYGQG